MNDNLYFPAEWEQQSMVQLTWPHAGTDWADDLDEITETFLQLAELITRYERLLIVAPDTDATKRQLEERLTDEALSKVTFCQCPTNDTWARDHGALTLRDRESGNTRLLNFRFNGWGEKFAAGRDNAINRSLADHGLLPGTSFFTQCRGCSIGDGCAGESFPGRSLRSDLDRAGQIPDRRCQDLFL